MCVCHGVRVEARGQLCGLALIYFGLPFCGFLESSSGLQTCTGSNLLAEPSHWPEFKGFPTLSQQFNECYSFSCWTWDDSIAFPWVWEQSQTVLLCTESFPDVCVLMLDFSQGQTVEMLKRYAVLVVFQPLGLSPKACRQWNSAPSFFSCHDHETSSVPPHGPH